MAIGQASDFAPCNKSGEPGGNPIPDCRREASMKIVVFSGPSIAEAEVHRLAACTHAPPIKRGDLDTSEDYDVFVILDGEFGQNLSVSPKEILAVLERGKTVIGASSMGALRASELDRSGMIGVGWVYDYFRRSAVRRDADVALVYSPFDFKPITVPMVDLEYWMEQASAVGLIANRERSLLLKVARNIFFADRTPERLTGELTHAIGGTMLDSLLAFSGGTIPSVKAVDAVEAVRLGAELATRHQRANR
jgi:TfuA protein